LGGNKLKLLKILVLMVFSLLLIVFLVIFQIDNMVNNTVLSTAYFNNAFDKNVTADRISDFAAYLKSSAADIQPDDLKKVVQDAVDVHWLQNDVPVFLKGSFSYFTTGKGQIPVLSIKPLKDAANGYIASHPEAGALLETQVEFSKMKDSLDLSMLFSKMYGNQDNPVVDFGPMMGSLRNGFFLLILLVAALLLAVIAMVAFTPKSVLKWCGASLVVAGTLCLIPAVLPAIFSGAIASQAAAAIGSGGQPGLLFLQDWALFYINGVAGFLLVQSIVLLLLGICLLVAARFMRGDSNEARRQPRHVAARAAAALLLLFAIPFSGYLVMRGMAKPVLKFDDSIKAASQIKGTAFGNALDETLGGHLGELLNELKVGMK
jgi:hypothetical protein